MEKLELPVEEGHIYRCPVEGCHCEISIEQPPQSVPPNQPFVDCCGHEMVKVSVDEAYGRGQEEKDSSPYGFRRVGDRGCFRHSLIQQHLANTSVGELV